MQERARYLSVPYGHEQLDFIVQPHFDAGIEDYLRPLFQQYYTMSFDNYPVELERIERADVRALK